MNNQVNEFDQIRQVYISNMENRVFPILPAYYYYINHNNNKKDLSQEEFKLLFIQATQDSYNVISQEIKPAVLNIENILSILDNYYNVHELHDKEGNLIKLV